MIARRCVLAFASALIGVLPIAASAQTGGNVIHPDVVVPAPAPRAPIAHWVNAAGRTTVALGVPGATLRGYRYATAAASRGADTHAAFDETTMLAHVTVPLLIVHGTADIDVPIIQGRHLFAAAGTKNKTFVAVPGEDHDGIVSAPRSLAAVRTFLASLK